MRHHPKTTFVTRSQPAEPEPTNRELYLAAHPKARQVQDSFAAEFQRRLTDLQTGIGTLFRGLVDKAESARQLGILLIEFCESELPGKKLTRDLYEQLKPIFVDGQGRQLSFETLEWLMATTRKCLTPIEDLPQAVKWQQLLLVASGESELQLEAERPPAQRIPPKDEWGKLTAWLENPELEQIWPRLKTNPAYFPGGHLRPDLRAIMVEEWKPKFAVLDELRRELGI